MGGHESLGAINQFEADACAFLEAFVPVHFDGRKMDECIGTATIGFDEPEALGIVEPLDFTVGHDGLQLTFVHQSGATFPPCQLKVFPDMTLE